MADISNFIVSPGSRDHMTTAQIDLLVAKLEGVEVELYNGHVAIRLPFDPEGPAHAFASDHECMWRFFEPTNDWDIIGPIADREQIHLSHGTVNGERFSQAAYADADGDAVLCQATGACGPEAVARSYVMRYLGTLVNMSQLPTFLRTAVVHVSVMRADFDTIEDDSDTPLFTDLDIEVEAETMQQATRMVRQRYESEPFTTIHFIRWAEPLPAAQTW